MEGLWVSPLPDIFAIWGKLDRTGHCSGDSPFYHHKHLGMPGLVLGHCCYLPPTGPEICEPIPTTTMPCQPCCLCATGPTSPCCHPLIPWGFLSWLSTVGSSHVELHGGLLLLLSTTHPRTVSCSPSCLLALGKRQLQLGEWTEKSPTTPTPPP